MHCAWDGMRETVSFEQNPAQAPISGTSSSKQRHPTRRRPNPATETCARAPGPWCVIRDALSLAPNARDHAFLLRPLAMRALWDGSDYMGPSISKTGNYVDLRAETDVLAVLSNCPQVNEYNPTPIQIVVSSGS